MDTKSYIFFIFFCLLILKEKTFCFVFEEDDVSESVEKWAGCQLSGKVSAHICKHWTSV